ncbi:MAG TPA: CBS domain-containing protein [Solirubrobacteraceae bacterium]|nr:CBS domain-containing protein [Solirubrobacteraceae bacterium]
MASETDEAVLVEPEATIQAASAAILDAREQAAVVASAGKVHGVIGATEIARALAEGHEAASTPVKEVLDRDAPRVDADEPLAEVRQRMRAAGRPLAIVLGRHGEPVGLLADHEAAP